MFILAQDCDEIYLIFPILTKGFTEAKDVNKLEDEEFLIMEEFGPFKLNLTKDLTELAEFILAYTDSLAHWITIGKWWGQK